MTSQQWSDVRSFLSVLVTEIDEKSQLGVTSRQALLLYSSTSTVVMSTQTIYNVDQRRKLIDTLGGNTDDVTSDGLFAALSHAKTIIQESVSDGLYKKHAVILFKYGAVGEDNITPRIREIATELMTLHQTHVIAVG